MNRGIDKDIPPVSEFKVVPVSQRYYKVVRLIKTSQEVELGIYTKNEIWATSYFYITDQGVNHWISRDTFVQGQKELRDNLKELWKLGKEKGFEAYKEAEIPEARFPKPRPETAVWVETETRPAGELFKPYLTHATPPPVDLPSLLLSSNSTIV